MSSPFCIYGPRPCTAIYVFTIPVHSNNRGWFIPNSHIIRSSPPIFLYKQMEVSWNGGTPKSSGVPPFMETTISHMLHGAGIFTNICPKKYPNVGKYTIHWEYGYGISKTGPKITGPLLEFALGLLQQRLLRFRRSQWISGKQRRFPVTGEIHG